MTNTPGPMASTPNTARARTTGLAKLGEASSARRVCAGCLGPQPPRRQRYGPGAALPGAIVDRAFRGNA